MNTHECVLQIGKQALHASRALAQLSTEKKNTILSAMADAVDEARSAIQDANDKDLAAIIGFVRL